MSSSSYIMCIHTTIHIDITYTSIICDGQTMLLKDFLVLHRILSKSTSQRVMHMKNKFRFFIFINKV